MPILILRTLYKRPRAHSGQLLPAWGAGSQLPKVVQETLQYRPTLAACRLPKQPLESYEMGGQGLSESLRFGISVEPGTASQVSEPTEASHYLPGPHRPLRAVQERLQHRLTIAASQTPQILLGAQVG